MTNFCFSEFRDFAYFEMNIAPSFCAEDESDQRFEIMRLTLNIIVFRSLGLQNFTAHFISYLSKTIYADEE